MAATDAGAPGADGSARRPSGAFEAALAAAVLVGFVLRIFAARDKILWFDEFLSGNLIRHSWGALLPAIRVEAHPPLYFVLLKAWRDVFGDGAFGLKSLSVAAGTAAIAFLADAVRRVRGEGAGIAAAVLVALSTVQIDQSAEAKPYAVLAFFLALLLWSTVRDRESPTAASLGRLLAVGLAAASTHFYGEVAAAAIAACALVFASGARERRRAALLFAAVAAVSVVWLVPAFRIPAGAADYIRSIWGKVPRWAPLLASSRIAFPGWRRPYPWMLGKILPSIEPREIAGAAVVVLTAGAWLAGSPGRAEPALRPLRRFLALAAVAIWPGFLLLESLLAAVDRPIAIPGRSEVVVELGFAILVGFAAARWGRRAPLPIAALAAVGLWTVVPQWRPRPGPRGRRWEEVIVRRLQAVVPPAAHVDIVTLGLGRPPFDYYADGDPRLRFISFPESQNAHPGWAAHSVSSAERASLAREADRLTGYLDAELRRGIPVYVVAREDPRNAWLLSALRRDHEIRPVPWGAGWFKEVVLPPVLSAGAREPFSASGVRKHEGGPTCDAEFEPVFSFSSSGRPRRRSMPPPTAGSRSRCWSAATRGASTPPGGRFTWRRSAGSRTLSA